MTTATKEIKKGCAQEGGNIFWLLEAGRPLKGGGIHARPKQEGGGPTEKPRRFLSQEYGKLQSRQCQTLRES